MKAKVALVEPEHTDKKISIADHILGEKNSSTTETGFLKKTTGSNSRTREAVYCSTRTMPY
jgi:hypothetical protein